MHLLKLILIPILVLSIFSCKNPESSDVELSLITLKNPPAEGSNLPSTFNYELDYKIADSEYNGEHEYKIMAFLWTDAAPFFLGETVLSGSSGTVNLDIPFPTDGIPVEVLIPYRLYFTLTDTSDGKDLFTSEEDLIYNEMYSGTWYQMGTKVMIENTSSIRYDYDFTIGAYVKNSKGYHQRVSQNGYQMVFTHEWDSDAGAWELSENATSYFLYIYLNSQGNLEVKEEDGTLFQLMIKDANRYTYTSDYCEKWWTSSVKIEDGDSGLILWLSDSEFDTTRDNQHNVDAVERFPDHEKGTVSNSGNTLVLQVTHEYDGSEYVETDSGNTYKFDYTYDASGDEPELIMELTDDNQANGFSGFNVIAGDITFEL